MMCLHEKTKITLTHELKHYAREDCETCGKFIKWVKNPKTIEREQENERRVKALQSRSQSEWTKGFLASFPKKPTSKQQEKLDAIWSEQR